jgi:TP901 family phage tail tape measure protein
MPDSVEYNLFTRFHFKNQPGLSQMRQTGGAFNRLHRSAKLAQTGVRQVGSGFRQLGMFGAGVGMVLGAVVKRGMEFGKQFANVKAVTYGTAAQYKALEKQAQTLGATTLFTATQAAEGMEHLSRAGLSVGQVQRAVRPVLKLAIADNVELGLAAQVTASALNQFKIDASKTSRVTDMFAYVSRNTMTNVTELGEAFKYAAPAARLAKQSFNDTIGTLGLFAQIGIRGSLAGTAFKNALLKLTKGSDAARKLFGGKKGFNAVLTDTTGRMRRLPEIVARVIGKLKGVKNDAERAALAFKIFGLRGVAGLSAFKEADPAKLAALIKNIGSASVGTAEQMARIKQESLWGQWTLFKSAVDGAAMSLYKMFLPSIKKVLTGPGGAIETMSSLAGAVKMVNAGFSESKVAKKYGQTIAAVAIGIKEGFTAAGKAIKGIFKSLGKMFGAISGEGKSSTKRIAKLVTKFGLLAAALTPVIAGVGALGLAFSGVFSIVSGGLKVLRALVSRWGLVFLGLTALFSGGQREGESFFTTMIRGMKNIISFGYKLTAPFRWLIDNIGAIPTLIGGIAAVKIGKAALAGAVASRAGGGVLGSVLGGVQKVWVVGPPTLIAGGAAGAVAGAAGAARGGAIGAGIAWLGGKLSAAGTSIFGPFFLNMDKASVALGTAGTALVGFGGAIAVAGAGLYELGKAYDPEHQRKMRLAALKESARKRNLQFLADLKKGIVNMFGQQRGIDPESAHGRRLKRLQATGPGWAAKEYQTLGQDPKLRTQFLNSYIIPFARNVALAAAAGGPRKELAGQALKRTGVAPLLTHIFDKLDPSLLIKEYGFTVTQVQNLIEMVGKATQAISESGKQKVVVNIDGKQVAAAVAFAGQESGERAGKTPSPGARRRALERGK